MCCHCEDFFVNVRLILALCVLFWHKERTHSYGLLFCQLFCRGFYGKCSSVDISPVRRTSNRTSYPRNPCGRLSMWLAVVWKQNVDSLSYCCHGQNIIASSTVAKPKMLFCYNKKKIDYKKSCILEYFTFVFVYQKCWYCVPFFL